MKNLFQKVLLLVCVVIIIFCATRGECKEAALNFSLVIAVIAAAGYTAYESQTSNELNGLALDNVEAIARGEGGGFGYTSHTYKCSYPDYKWAVAYTKGGVDSCYPSDC